VTTATVEAVLRDAGSIPARAIGTTGGQDIALEGEGALPLAELRQLHESWFPTYMSGKS
jgi:phosphoribosylformylglycinamidine synthase